MSSDRHVGRQKPIFNIKANPETFVRLINTHGVFARIMEAHKCPCVTASGSPDMYCILCNGDGKIYAFQRDLFQPDEDSDTNYYGDTVYPWRVPITKVKQVERLLPDEQGGIEKYTVESFTDTQITISGENLPKKYEKMRVSYYFDRFEKVENEVVEVDADNKILTTIGTLYDDEHKTSNIFNVHGDIVIVDKIWHSDTLYEYTDFTFKKNKVYIADTEPAVEVDKIIMNYHYCPVTKVLPQEIIIEEEIQEKTLIHLMQGMVRIAMDYWFKLSEGDLITLFSTILYKNEVLVHQTDLDKLYEFDIANIHDRIFDEDGNIYHVDTDYILKNFRDLHWLSTGRQPAGGKKISVRFGYHPTYVVFGDQPMPNTMENRYYPQVVNAKLWAKTLDKDVEKMPSENHDNPMQDFWQ